MKTSLLCSVALKKANKNLAVISKTIENKAEESITPLYKSTWNLCIVLVPSKVCLRSIKGPRKGKKNGGKYGRTSTGELDS